MSIASAIVLALVSVAVGLAANKVVAGRSQRYCLPAFALPVGGLWGAVLILYRGSPPQAVVVAFFAIVGGATIGIIVRRLVEWQERYRTVSSDLEAKGADQKERKRRLLSEWQQFFVGGIRTQRGWWPSILYVALLLGFVILMLWLR